MVAWSSSSNFNPRHPYGWRLILLREKAEPFVFQSTPPIRVATSSCHLFCQPTGFQSTPPIRVATHSMWIPLQAFVDFNPRHPYGWRPVLIGSDQVGKLFQSTPPIRVATFIQDENNRERCISIHATHTGGDFSRAANIAAENIFQSTPPIRVATGAGQPDSEPLLISIHATHTGGDTGEPAAVGNPVISIHATHTGGDARPVCYKVRSPYFNPRHPYGWRPDVVGLPGIHVISIHATHTGGDLVFYVSFHGASNFNPRHPYGWRPHGWQMLTWKHDFNPRHPYGWRP